MEVSESKIDNDILEFIKEKGKVFEAISSTEEVLRAMMNFEAESLSELIQLREITEQLSTLIATLSLDKLSLLLGQNLKKEE